MDSRSTDTEVSAAQFPGTTWDRTHSMERETTDAPTAHPSWASGDTPSTVFLGESSSLRDSGPSESAARFCFSLPPAKGGEISTSSLARAGRRTKRLEYLNNLGAFSFPSDAVSSEILLAFFTWFHPCFPIVDRALFATAFACRTVSPLLLQSMLFVGATYCSDDALQSMGFVDRLDARSSFYSHAKDIYDADHEQDKLIVVQALFLLSYWRAGPQIEKNTRHWLAASINLAQMQGLHRMRLATPNPVELKLRKRIWWTLYIRDRQCSTAVGLPWFIHDRDCDVDELDQRDFDEAVIVDIPDFLTLQTPEAAQYPIQMAKLAMIMGEIISIEFVPNHQQDLGVKRAKVKERLLQWECQLASDIASYRRVGSPPNLLASSLHAYYNNLFILLYRSAFVANEEGGTTEEGQIVLQAAQRITSIAEDLLSEDLVRYANTHLITCFFNSLCIHTISLRRSKGIAQQVAENRAHTCLLGLKELRKTWEVDNWVLRLFFRHMEKPIVRRLQRPEVDAGHDHQRNPSPGLDTSTAEPNDYITVPASHVEVAYDPPTMSLPDRSEPDVFDFDWTDVSQFFNSKEAEDFSLFQLGSSTFTNEDLQSIYS